MNMRKKIVILTLILLILVLFPILSVAQEKHKTFQEELQEFWNHYRSSLQDGNKQKAEQLIQKNREHAKVMAKLLLDQGIESYQAANYETTLTIFMASQDLYQQLGDRRGETIVLIYIGSIYQNANEYQQALSYYREALNISREVGNKLGEGTILNNTGLIYQSIGEYQEALSYYQEALNINREIGDKAGEGASLNNIGAIYTSIGNYQQALSYYRVALNISREIADKAGEGRVLSNIGSIYKSIGKYQQALHYYKGGLNISREIGDKSGEGGILNNIGSVYRGTGEYQQALSYSQEALSIRRKIGDKAGEGASLNNIGSIYQSIGEYQEALNYYIEALNINRKIGDKAGEGASLNNIGLIYQSIGEYQEVLSYYQEALNINRKIGNKAGEGASLNNIGMFYLSIGEYHRALNYLQEVLNISREIGDKAGEGANLNNIGAIYRNIGNYQQALNYYQEALNISKEIEYKEGANTVLNNIGAIYQGTGDYQQALNYCQQALNISREIGDKAGEGASLNNIGTIYHTIGEYRQALDYYQEVLTIYKEIGHKAGEGAALNNIGVIYQATAAYQQALDYSQEALIIHKAISDRAGEGTALNTIGMIYHATGEYQQALASLQEALTIDKEIGDRANEGKTLNNIGTIYHATGEYQQALASLQEALTIDKEIGNRAGEGTTLANIGYMYAQQGQWREAVGYYQQAIALLEVIWNKASGSEAKESFLGQRINVYTHTVKLLLHLNAPEDAFAYTERSKARSFLEQLYEASTGVKHGVDQQLLAEETNLYGKLSVIEQKLKKQLSSEQREQLLKERHSLEHELSVLQMKLRSSNPRYAELKYPQPVTVEQVQQHILQKGDVLVEYFIGDEELYVFIIGKTSFFSYPLKNSRKDLYSKMKEATANGTTYEVYQMIFQPLEEKILEVNQGKEVNNLIIVPDGILFYQPFEMLVTNDGEDSEYLVDRYTISYAPSASVLKPEILHARQPEQYAQDLLALAPFSEAETTPAHLATKATEYLLLSDTLRSGLEGVQPLPYSAREVQTISRLYPQSVCKIGADATKAFFKDHAKGNHYLHLSTHGYLDPEHAMYSGLLFSDGMLQTYEIFNMDIDAELTVLSACQTGLGELKTGEGLVGLTRAFMYAGSPSVLVSLWSVSDPSTAAFMKRFYRNLNKGMTKAKALQETKIWMKEKSYHTDEHGNVIKHDHPFYWAPFILVGSGGHSLKEAPPIMPTPTLSQKLSQEEVLTLQKRLVELGYNPGPIDGIWGKKTESALKKFQQDNGLSVTGKLDEETQKKLGW